MAGSAAGSARPDLGARKMPAEQLEVVSVKPVSDVLPLAM
jgi:hypothetical protein